MAPDIAQTSAPGDERREGKRRGPSCFFLLAFAIFFAQLKIERPDGKHVIHLG